MLLNQLICLKGRDDFTVPFALISACDLNAVIATAHIANVWQRVAFRVHAVARWLLRFADADQILDLTSFTSIRFGLLLDRTVFANSVSRRFHKRAFIAMIRLMADPDVADGTSTCSR